MPLLSRDAGLCASATSRLQIDSAHQGVSQGKPEPKSNNTAPQPQRAPPAAGDCRQGGPPGMRGSQSAGGGKGGPSQMPPATPRPPSEAKRQATGDAPCPKAEGPGRREGPGRHQTPPGHTEVGGQTGGADPSGQGGAGGAGTGPHPAGAAPLPSPDPTETHRDAAALAVAGPSAAPGAPRPARAHRARSRDGPAPAPARGEWGRPRCMPGDVVRGACREV